jgi:hypothetical protein
LENTTDKTFYQQGKRTTKLMITDCEINAVKRVNLPGFDVEETVKIQKLHKKLLTRAKNKNNSNEVGMLVNLRDWSDIMVNGTEEGVTLKGEKKACELLCTAPKNSLLFFHNHPKNSLFSEKDLESFMTSDAIWMMSVVCNNGRLYFLIKTDKYNREKALAYYEQIFETGEKDSVHEFIRTCGKAGLDFIYGGE